MSRTPACASVERFDIGLAILGVVAIIVISVAFASGSSWADEHQVTYGATSAELASQGPFNARGAGANFNWSVPDNSTSATFQVTVTFTGQAIQGGIATVTARLQMPDGHYAHDVTAPLTIGQGATSVTATFNITGTWAKIPESSRDTGKAIGSPMTWSAPLRLLVSASPPSDLPAATYGFAASASGAVLGYAAN